MKLIRTFSMEAGLEDLAPLAWQEWSGLVLVKIENVKCIPIVSGAAQEAGYIFIDGSYT